MRKLIIITVAILAIVALFLGYMYAYQKRVLGLICDKVGITKNTFEVEIDKKLEYYTFIYWYGETPHPAKKNRLLIFYRFPQSDIPPSPGKNWIKIQIFEDIIYSNMGIYKLQSFSKHNYRISIKLVNDSVIINWRIDNWYETEVMQGNDTIVLTKTEKNMEMGEQAVLQ